MNITQRRLSLFLTRSSSLQAVTNSFDKNVQTHSMASAIYYVSNGSIFQNTEIPVPIRSFAASYPKFRFSFQCKPFLV